MKRTINFLVFAIIASLCFGQQLEIASPMSHAGSVGAASVPNDNNGNPCAKIIVELPLEGAIVEGSYVVGKVAYSAGQYELFVAIPKKEGQTLTIRHGKYASTTVPLWTGDGALVARQAYKVHVMPKGAAADGSSVGKIQMGYLVMTSVPDGADVYLDGEFAGNTTLQKKFPIGREVEYRVSKSMYHDYTGKITITSTKNPLNVELKPAFGSLSVNSTPSGAKVFVDGEEAGVTPFSREKVMSGEHDIKVQKDMYAPQVRTVTVADGERATVTIPLEARFATLRVKSLPGAVIKIEGKNAGTSEASSQLMEGMYDIEASLESHRTVRQQIEIVAGKDQVVEMKPTPIYGLLSVESIPIDAEILINGKSYGTTPTIIDNLLIGSYSITLRKNGCADYNATFSIRENEETTLTGTLAQGKEITISTDKSGDQIYIDDTLAGTSPLTTSLSFGNHTVYAKRGSEKTGVEKVNVTTSMSNTMTLSFGLGKINGHEWVDLGLPSGLKWATCNVGATKPEEYGDYFAWGETKSKSSYTESNSATYGKDNSWLKSNGYIDSRGNLSKSHDAASANWGSTWRMPTSDEINELVENTTTEWTTRNGVKVRLVKSKRNGNSIFIPAAGYRDGTGLYGAGGNGYCWSSTPYEGSANYAYDLYFYSGIFGRDWDGRFCGQSVRPVSE